VTFRTEGGRTFSRGGAPDRSGAQVVAQNGEATAVTGGRDLLEKGGGDGAALVPALVEVGLEVIENAGEALPLAGHQFLPGGGAGETADGVAGQAQFPRDRALRAALVDQGVHGLVALAGPVRIPVGGAGRVARRGDLLQFR
jgi:hypothetical protein